MAQTKKVLAESELDERLRIGTKKNILALIEAGKVDDKKMKNFLASWKQINSEMQMRCGERSRQMRFLQMLPKDMQGKAVVKAAPLLLAAMT